MLQKEANGKATTNEIYWKIAITEGQNLHKHKAANTVVVDFLSLFCFLALVVNLFGIGYNNRTYFLFQKNEHETWILTCYIQAPLITAIGVLLVDYDKVFLVLDEDTCS